MCITIPTIYLNFHLPVLMPRSSLTAFLLQSGYKVVNQSADHPALPENYRSPVSQLHSNDNAQQQQLAASTSTAIDSPYVPVGYYTLYTSGL